MVAGEGEPPGGGLRDARLAPGLEPRSRLTTSARAHPSRHARGCSDKHPLDVSSRFRGFTFVKVDNEKRAALRDEQQQKRYRDACDFGWRARWAPARRS